MEINNHLEDEIDLRDLINHLIKSKIIIIITTVIFALMAVSYNYLAPKPKPVYQSTAKLVVGHLYNTKSNEVVVQIGHDQTRVLIPQFALRKIAHLNKNNLVKSLLFYFPEMTSILGSGEKFIEIKLNGPSIEKNTIKLKEVIDHAINDSEEKIERRKQEIKLEILNTDMEIASINYSLDLLPSEVDLTNNDEMVMYVNRLKYQKSVFENKALSAKNNLEAGLYLTTNIHGEIKSRQINTSKDKSIINLLFSAIAGLLLSIIVLTFRYVFLKK